MKVNAQKRYAAIRQAKRTIYNIQRRKKLGIERPADKELLLQVSNTLKKYEAMEV